MKKTLFVLMMCAMCILTACEKHDGIDYFKAKCVAELNGQTFIDQTPFTISPNAIITPSLELYDNSLRFTTYLRPERNGQIACAIKLFIYADDMDDLFDKELKFEKLPDIESSVEGDPSYFDYIRYCIQNKISCAEVTGEIVESGSFKITSYDKEKHQYKGFFTLKFSEGTIKGKFDL